MALNVLTNKQTNKKNKQTDQLTLNLHDFEVMKSTLQFFWLEFSTVGLLNLTFNSDNRFHNFLKYRLIQYPIQNSRILAFTVLYFKI